MASTRTSAGIVLWRRTGGGEIEVLLVHPGGPYWARRDEGWWSIPKGETETGEDHLAAAEREFGEELGSPAPPGARVALGEVTQRASKRVVAWAVAGDFDPAELSSATFTLQWPPNSGTLRQFPEVDRAEWFGPALARRKILPTQLALLERLADVVADPSSPADMSSGAGAA